MRRWLAFLAVALSGFFATGPAFGMNSPELEGITSSYDSATISSTSFTAQFIRGSDWGGGVGGLLYSVRGDVPSYKHYDARGDVVDESNSSGTSTWQGAYEAYGSRLENGGTASADRQRGNTKEEDPLGFRNDGFRYYDLTGDVYITRDPAGFVDGPNVYTYVVQNPWSKFDPEGLQVPTAEPPPDDVGGEEDASNDPDAKAPSNPPGETYFTDPNTEPRFLPPGPPPDLLPKPPPSGPPPTQLTFADPSFENQPKFQGTAPSPTGPTSGSSNPISNPQNPTITTSFPPSASLPNNPEPSATPAPSTLPPNRGFVPGQGGPATILPGQLLDRYGNPTGNFLSPAGTPPEARSLPPGVVARPVLTYQVATPFEVSGAGAAAPAYNQPGLGLQFDTSPNTVQDLIDAGMLIPITSPPLK